MGFVVLAVSDHGSGGLVSFLYAVVIHVGRVGELLRVWRDHGDFVVERHGEVFFSFFQLPAHFVVLANDVLEEVSWVEESLAFVALHSRGRVYHFLTHFEHFEVRFRD